MADSKTILAVGLAAATLVVFVVVIAMGEALRAGLAPWPGIAVAVLAIAAFAVSGERRSVVVAGLLGASGVVGVVYGLIRTDFLMASSFPGPIFGIILGLRYSGWPWQRPLEPPGTEEAIKDVRAFRRHDEGCPGSLAG